MRVRLTQLDGKLPNLALMRLAAWHRGRGHEVVFTRSVEREMFEREYGAVYGSAIFTASQPLIERFRQCWPSAIVGGTGSGSAITVEQVVGGTWERCDYQDHPGFLPSLGFTARGCRMKCRFCMVPGAEGRPRSVNTIADLWRGPGHARKLLLLDNDFFGQPTDQWQARIAEIRGGDFRVCFSQGINIRLVDDRVAVADGLAAIEAVFAQRFDVVLLDMIMPGMNGDEVLKAIKADHRLRSLPVIMISALDALDRIVRCIEAGAEDYLPKPFNRVLLRARIGACLEKKRLREVELSYLQAVEKELTIAREVQRSILPKAFPTHGALIGHGLMDPAREVGGDFYDFFALGPNRIGLAVGDVSGKGVPAAVYMAMARTQLRATALFGLSPAECLGRLNDHLSADNPEGMFVSLFYGIIDCATGRFTYANGGHNWPVRLRADGRLDWIKGTDDLLVGVMPGVSYHDAALVLEAGDSLFLYTDGVVEAVDPAEEEFGKTGLAAVLAGKADLGPAALCDEVLAAVRSFEGGQPHSDDLTCLAARFLGRG